MRSVAIVLLLLASVVSLGAAGSILVLAFGTSVAIIAPIATMPFLFLSALCFCGAFRIHCD